MTRIWWSSGTQRGDKLRNNLSCFVQFVTPKLVMSWAAPLLLVHSIRELILGAVVGVLEIPAQQLAVEHLHTVLFPLQLDL